MSERIALFERIVRPMFKQDLNLFRRLGEDEAVAVGFELARRVRLRPERYPRVPATLAEAALDGPNEARRKAALELVTLKLGLRGRKRGRRSPPLGLSKPSSGRIHRFLHPAGALVRRDGGARCA